MNGKLKAYTILEVTISMLISALLIGITYSAYQVVSSSYKGYLQNQRKIQSLLAVDFVFKQDVLSADLIVKSDEQLKFLVKEGFITYEFADSVIIRSNSVQVRDTFQLKIDSVSFGTAGSKIDEEEIIDRISITGKSGGKRIVLDYSKKYSADQFIN